MGSALAAWLRRAPAQAQPRPQAQPRAQPRAPHAYHRAQCACCVAGGAVGGNAMPAFSSAATIQSAFSPITPTRPVSTLVCWSFGPIAITRFRIILFDFTIASSNLLSRPSCFVIMTVDSIFACSV